MKKYYIDKIYKTKKDTRKTIVKIRDDITLYDIIEYAFLYLVIDRLDKIKQEVGEKECDF